MFLDPVAVFTAGDVIYPVLVVQIPLHSLADTRLKGFLGFPAEFTFELTRINRIAAVVAGAILHEGNLRAVALAIGTWFELVENGTKRMYNVEVGLLVPATDVVGFAQLAGFKHAADGTAVVFDVEPVTDLLTVTIDR